QLVTISGRKFNDLNGSGVDVASDPGLGGWTIILVNATTSAEVARTTTNPDGSYSFGNIVPGTYRISEVLKDGWVQAFPSNRVYTFTVRSGKNVSGRNFGNFQLVSISGQKWNDTDGDGIRQSSEVTLSGFTIQLVDSTGRVVDSKVTDATGSFKFPGVGPGTFTLGEVPKQDGTQTFPAAPGTFVITTMSGVDVTGRDFGNIQGRIIVGGGGSLLPLFGSTGTRVV